MYKGELGSLPLGGAVDQLCSPTLCCSLRFCVGLFGVISSVQTEFSSTTNSYFFSPEKGNLVGLLLWSIFSAVSTNLITKPCNMERSIVHVLHVTPKSLKSAGTIQNLEFVHLKVTLRDHHCCFLSFIIFNWAYRLTKPFPASLCRGRNRMGWFPVWDAPTELLTVKWFLNCSKCSKFLNVSKWFWVQDRVVLRMPKVEIAWVVTCLQQQVTGIFKSSTNRTYPISASL